MARSADSPRSDVPAFVAVLLLAITAGGILDLILDAPSSLWTAHVLVEIALVVLSLGTAIYLWTGWRGAERSLESARLSLEARSEERDSWRAKAELHLRGLGVAIDEQLRAWQLTPAERETAHLILAGHSHKRIAALTSRSERTVRQHATSVYRKARMSGRAELSAFFLGDLPSAAEGKPAET